MNSNNCLHSYTASASPKPGGVPLLQIAPSLIVIIANYARAKGVGFVSPEQQQAVITNYCHMAAQCN